MHLLSLLLLLPLLPALAQTTPQLHIYTSSTSYAYQGCYNETTEIQGSDGSRALSGGASSVQKGAMTVPICLDFCAKADNGSQYRYAGLEWSRECWCAQKMAGISQRLDDAECSFPCEGNTTLACGGSLKLSVYKLSGASAHLGSASNLAFIFMAATTMLVF